MFRITASEGSWTLYFKGKFVVNRYKGISGHNLRFKIGKKWYIFWYWLKKPLLKRFSLKIERLAL